VRRLGDLDKAERTTALGAFLTLAGIMAGHALTETARDAMFLAKLSVDRLAGVYLVIAALSFVLAPLEQRLLRRFGAPLGLSVLLVAGAAVLLVFHAAAKTGTNYTFVALYIHSSLFVSLVTVHFWLLLGNKFTLTQAKRAYGLVGAGSVVGALAGALVARALTQFLEVRRLLVAGAIALLVSAVGSAAFLQPDSKEKARPAHRRSFTLAENLPLLRQDPYMRRVAAIVLTSTVAFTLVDYLFKRIVAQHVQPADLGRFFSTTLVVLNLAALVTQLGLVTWLVRALGVTRALALLPVLLIAGSAGIALGGGLAAVLVLKGADGGLRHTVHRTGLELLYLPIPERVRARVKALMDGSGQRVGQAIGSLLVLAGTGFGGRAVAFLSLTLVALTATWLLTARGLRRHYLDLFRATLSTAGGVRPELPALDVRSLETLIGALNSSDDREVLATLDLLEAQDRTRLLPALILYHPSPAVVLRALDLLRASGRRDHLPLLDRLLRHADPDVRSAALTTLAQTAGGEHLLTAALADPSPVVRAAALVELAAGDHAGERRLPEATLDEIADWPGDATLALARAIRRRPSPKLARVIEALARSSDPRVLVEVAEAAAALGGQSFVPHLIRMLGVHDARATARKGLLAAGRPALLALDRALSDPTCPASVRRHVPRAIGRFGAALAAPILVGHIPRTQGVMRYRILRALGYLAAESPDVPLDEEILTACVRETLAWARRLLALRRALAAGAARGEVPTTRALELIVALLEDKEARAVEQLFQLLDLLYRNEDFRRIHRGLRGDDPVSLAGSRELCEHVLEAPLRDEVRALLDARDAAQSDEDVDEEDVDEVPAPEHEALLAEMLTYPSVSLRALVAHHVGELGLTGLRGQLERAGPADDGPLAVVIARALARLDRVRESEVPRAG
jgi:ATP:ADP antiporter, AAA family